MIWSSGFSDLRVWVTTGFRFGLQGSLLLRRVPRSSKQRLHNVRGFKKANLDLSS